MLKLTAMQHPVRWRSASVCIKSLNWLHNRLFLFITGRRSCITGELSENRVTFLLPCTMCVFVCKLIAIDDCLGAHPRAPLMLSVHRNGVMLGFHGDTGICQTVMCLLRISATGPAEHVHVYAGRMGWRTRWMGLGGEILWGCFQSKLSHISTDHSTALHHLSWETGEQKVELDGERQTHTASQNAPKAVFESQEETVSVCKHLPPPLLFSRRLHLLSHFHPSSNHRDHSCPKRGFSLRQKWWCQMLDVCMHTKAQFQHPLLFKGSIYRGRVLFSKHFFSGGHVLLLCAYEENRRMWLSMKISPQ